MFFTHPTTLQGKLLKGETRGQTWGGKLQSGLLDPKSGLCQPTLVPGCGRIKAQNNFIGQVGCCLGKSHLPTQQRTRIVSSYVDRCFWSGRVLAFLFADSVCRLMVSVLRLSMSHKAGFHQQDAGRWLQSSGLKDILQGWPAQPKGPQMKKLQTDTMKRTSSYSENRSK